MELEGRFAQRKKQRARKRLFVILSVLGLVALCCASVFAAILLRDLFSPPEQPPVISSASVSLSDTDSTDVTDITDSQTETEPEIRDPDLYDMVYESDSEPLYGAQYATSPLPQWSFPFAFTEKIIEIARAEPSDAEDESGVTKYGTYFGDPDGEWCTEFALWCVIQADEYFKTSYVKTYYPYSDWSGGCIQWYKARNCYYSPSKYVPRRGDMVFFDTDLDGKSDHTGLITGVTYDVETRSLFVTTIEGNIPEDYPNGVIRERVLSVEDPTIFGYGTFRYDPSMNVKPQQEQP